MKKRLATAGNRTHVRVKHAMLYQSCIFSFSLLFDFVNWFVCLFDFGELACVVRNTYLKEYFALLCLG